MQKCFICFLGLVFALAGPAHGQQQAGDTELQLQGTLSLATGGDLDHSGSVYLNYGRFFTDRQEWGLSVLGTFDDNGDLAGAGGPFYRYNFGTGEVVPFVGAAAVAGFGDRGFGDGALLQFEGGVRYFLDRNKAFTVAGQTQYSIDESELADTLDVLFGFSIFWD